MFTNCAGNRRWSLLSKTALMRTVPVDASIWLSSVSTLPAARCVSPVRSNTSTGRTTLSRIFGSTSRSVSSGTVKSTAIGSTSVITTSPVWLAAETMLPASTRRRPTRPLMGAVTRVYVRFSFALSMAARSTFSAPSSCATDGGLVVHVRSGDRVLREQQLIARELRLRVGELDSSRASCPSACSSCTWNGRGSITRADRPCERTGLPGTRPASTGRRRAGGRSPC